MRLHPHPPVGCAPVLALTAFLPAHLPTHPATVHLGQRGPAHRAGSLQGGGAAPHGTGRGGAGGAGPAPGRAASASYVWAGGWGCWGMDGCLMLCVCGAHMSSRQAGVQPCTANSHTWVPACQPATLLHAAPSGHYCLPPALAPQTPPTHTHTHTPHQATLQQTKQQRDELQVRPPGRPMVMSVVVAVDVARHTCGVVCVAHRRACLHVHMAPPPGAGELRRGVCAVHRKGGGCMWRPTCTVHASAGVSSPTRTRPTCCPEGYALRLIGPACRVSLAFEPAAFRHPSDLPKPPTTPSRPRPPPPPPSGWSG